jgi:hypothetical protein
MNRTALRLSQPFLAATLLLGCGAGNNPFTSVRDDVNSDLSLFPHGKSSDAIHAPYAAGSLVTFRAQGLNPLASHAGWTAEVPEGAVAKVERTDASKKALEVEVRMLAEGEARLRIFGDDKATPLRTVIFQVKMPTMVRLYAATQMKTVARESDVGELGDTLRVAVSGETSFMVRLFNDGGELFGHKTLSVLDSGNDAGPVARAEAGTAFRVWRDWLTLSSPSIPGVWQRTLAINGISMRTLTVRVVDTSEIASARLYTTGEGKDRSAATLIAEGLTSAGEPIYGGKYTWSLGGSNLDGAGDVFHYVVKTSASKDARATLGAGNATLNIHADTGSVGTSASQSCAQSGAAPWVACLMVLLAFRRRTQCVSPNAT